MQTPSGQDTQHDARNYSTISPSARTLLLLKGHTNIPFAREAAALSMLPEPYTPDFKNPAPGFWARVVHFEGRYSSINDLLTGLPASNILELSSGFSFRGLALTQDHDLNYTDTDLPELIEIKKQYIATLSKDLPAPKGHLQVLPLNALDEERFNAIVDAMPPGELIIVNEGLLMYLGREEKEQLCRIIHKILQRRGGYWITADIYLKRRFNIPEMERGDTFSAFLRKHNVESNMFDSFEEAKELFSSMGFTIDKEAEPNHAGLSTIQYFMSAINPELLTRLQQFGKIHATWRLRPTT